jgi:type IV protein arginine methyltransferase
VRTEFILGSIQENKDEQPSTYLTSPLTYSNGLLLDADLNAVMMGWEAPIMQKHVDILCEGRAEGFSIVNVGFGLGIVDEMIQKMKPGRHVIIEAHPDVYKHMLEQGWDKKKGVEIVFGKWQDVIEEVSILY